MTAEGIRQAVELLLDMRFAEEGRNLANLGGGA
jgi:hypothetical protein